MPNIISIYSVISGGAIDEHGGWVRWCEEIQVAFWLSGERKQKSYTRGNLF